MNPEVENLFNYIKKKRKREDDDISIEDIIKELKYIALEGLEQIIKEYKLKGNKLTMLLNILEETFNSCKDTLDPSSNENKEFNLLIIAYSTIIIEIIQDLKLELYSNKKLNLNKYFKNKKSNNYIHPEKRIKITPVDINIKNTMLVNDIYQSESEPETTDEEYVPEEDEDDNDDDNDDNDDDNDDDDGDEYEDDNIDASKSDRLLNKQFINEFNKSTGKGSSRDEVMNYFCNLDYQTKNNFLNELQLLNNNEDVSKPSLFKILNLPLSIDKKKTLLSTLKGIGNGITENNKLKTWLENILKLPFGIYKGINISNMNKSSIKKFIKNLKKEMDNAVWGHDHAKHKILQIMGQNLRNPDSKGSVLGIWGPPGNGKTTLIKEGISKAMDKPFVFISLGGATDASFLEGHSFTYEGSIYGRIARGIIESKCMDPIIYFDELDKVSCTYKGEEIVNLLVHLIDQSQNSKFRDKYFHDVDIDLSKVTFIFSFNEPRKVNYILMDRITTIETKNLTQYQKIHIAKNYLLKNILNDIGLEMDDIQISDDLLKIIINDFTNEGGVRKLKKLLYEICREINIKNLTNSKLNNKTINFPYELNKKNVYKILEDHYKYDQDTIHKEDSIGIVNGLWANCLGQGGILPIESLLIPTKGFMEIKATGSLEKVIKESIDVALSVAWNNLEVNIKNEWITKWKDKPDCFHIHCPEGAVSKDGPSAGAAITLVLYSRLVGKKINNKIAMTGEINLRGEVTKIGGLEEKLTGAKKAGVELVLIPNDNLDDLVKIKKRNKDLINENFKIIPIKHFQDVLKLSLVD